MKTESTFSSYININLNIKYIAVLLLSFTGSLAKAALNLNKGQVSLEMNDVNFLEKTSMENWPSINSNNIDSADDDMNCGAQYFGFSAADRQIDSNQYTVGLCVPASCSTIFSYTSASGQKLYNQALNLTQQIQLGKYNGVYQDPVQSSNVIMRLILITKSDLSPVPGDTIQTPIGYAIKFMSTAPYTETSFSLSVIDDFNSMAKPYQEAIKECQRISTGANTGIGVGVGLLVFLGAAAYKFRSNITEFFHDCSSRFIGTRRLSHPTNDPDGVQLISPGNAPGSAQQPYRLGFGNDVV